MRKLLLLFSTILVIGACGTKKIIEAKPAPPIVIQPKPLMNEIDSISYAFGLNVAQTFKQIKDESDGKYTLDVDRFAEGIKDVLKGSPKFSEQDQETILIAFGQKMEELISEKQKLEAIKAKEAGLQFLAANSKVEGVQVTVSGLQYKVIKEGEGMSPEASNKVTVHYVGTLLDGSTFDSSRDRGEPVTFELDQVIPGWTEGLQLMTVGSIYEFYIPSDLAYGDEGNQGIAGGSVLKFEVELFGFE